MKKMLTISLLVLTCSTAFAEVHTSISIGLPFPIRPIRPIIEEAPHRGERNQELRGCLQDLNRAQTDNKDLRDQLDQLNNDQRDHGDRRDEGHRNDRRERHEEFNLADSMRACALIKDTFYAGLCITSAKNKSIFASAIAECAQIKDSFYANSCVNYAGQKNVSADVVNACVTGNSDPYYQANCVNNI